MQIDPVWLAVFLSGLGVILAAIAVLRPRGTDPGILLLNDAYGDLRKDIEILRTAFAEDLGRGRDEAENRGKGLREEIGGTLRDGFTHLDGASGTFREEMLRRLTETRKGAEESGMALRGEIVQQLHALGGVLTQHLNQSGATQKERLDGVAAEIRLQSQRSSEVQESLRNTVESRLDALRNDNAAKLEEMRRTVDEKLQGTLEQRLNASFKLVSDQLEKVFLSVGEMQSLASGVGDLKRVLTNVKARGTWAEVSLGSLLDQIMTSDQFARNVEVRPRSGERVEYAIRLPGHVEDGDAVWLPIDAKFPSEDYERLLEASDRADGVAVEGALKGLEARIRSDGRTICDKYVCPPHTTDFAILYLPTEGLYAEVIRRPGLVDELQRSCRIVVAGPTVLVATLNSLRMGFRTLAIQKRSSEVWQTLAAVKTEFGKYGEVLEKVKSKLGQATRDLDQIAVRRRAIDKRLSSVERLPDIEAGKILNLEIEARPSLEDLEAAE